MKETSGQGAVERLTASLKPGKINLDDYNFTISSSNEDQAFVKIEGKDLIVEGGGLTVSGELFTFSSDVSKC